MTQIETKSAATAWQDRYQFVPRAITSLAPFRAVKSAGALITGDDGREYIDLTGGWGCLVVGHTHPRVVRAIQQQAEQFVHTDYSVVGYDLYVELARRLGAYAPGARPKKAAFFNSGAEAVENAVKISRLRTRRPGVVVFDRGFHGRTLLTMTMTHKATPYKAGFGPFASDVYRVPYPSAYHTPMPFAEWKRRFTALVDPKDVACVVVEPLQGEGGFIVPQEGFLQELRDFTRDEGIVLVFDEVQTGMGRTGRMFAAEAVGIEPDLITVGKSLASGLPLSGVIGVDEVIDAPGDSAIGGTYVGNPLACAAGLAVLDTIEDEGLLVRAEALGTHMRSRFEDMKGRYELIGDVRGLGSMVAMELVTDREHKTPATEQTAHVIQGALADGVITAKAGLHGNVLRMLIPLVIGEDELDRGLDVLEAQIAKLS